MKIKILDIKHPCQEDWEQMHATTSGAGERFCARCEEKVIDFSNRGKEEILAYLLMHKDKMSCMRISPAQCEFGIRDLMPAVENLARRSSNKNLPFYLLTLGSLFFASCGEKTLENVPSKAEEITSLDTIDKGNINTIDSVPPMTRPLVGKPIKIYNLEEFSGAEDKAPEFIGGIDSLNKFIAAHLIYPEAEQLAGIEGEVILSFLINKEGRVSEAKILKNTKNNENFARAALDLMEKMPNWIPATKHSYPQMVRYTLPIVFKLSK